MSSSEAHPSVITHLDPRHDPAPHHRALSPDGMTTDPWRLIWLFVSRRFPGRTVLLNVMAGGGVALMSMESVALKNIVDGLALAGGQWSADIVRWFAILAALWIGSALFNRGREVVDAYTLPALRHEVQFYLFSYLVGHSPRFFQDTFAGKLGQKVKSAGQAAIHILIILSNDIIRILIILGVALYLLAGAHPLFAVVLVGWSVLQLALSYLMAGRCSELSRRQSEHTSSSTGYLVDAIANIELVRAFSRQRHEYGLLSRALGLEEAGGRALRLYYAKMWFVLFNALLLFQVTLIGIAVHQALEGHMTVGDFSMVFSLSMLVGFNVWGLSTQLHHFFEQLGVLSEALETLSRAHEITDHPEARPLAVDRGAIRIEDLRFAHGDRVGGGGESEGAPVLDGPVLDAPVFDGLSLDIAGGAKVALVGPSGAGKSTLVKLLRRQFEAGRGRILIDGQDITRVTLDSLNHAVAEVPQSPALFHRSIFDNIAYADPAADREAVIDAARRARCHDFIMARDIGYDAVVGEQGIRLSGGERQRIAIARAFLKNAPILVLDEATSALDSETEHSIQDALLSLIEGRTVIAIAHRLSTITHMDRILFMEGGRIIEDGSHAELLAQRGRYAQLWTRQVGGFLPS